MKVEYLKYVNGLLNQKEINYLKNCNYLVI